MLPIVLLPAPPPAQQAPLPPPLPVRLVARMPPMSDQVPVIEIPDLDTRFVPGPDVAPDAPAPVHAATDARATELAVRCPERTAPRYPPMAKRLREEGEVRLRVELDESGRVDRVTIVSSSGFPRLDDAARTAVMSWRCRAAQRDGRPVRSVALQSLDFVLERH